MKYHQPFDQPGNPNASFVDGNPSAGVEGSIPPAAAIEYPQREIVQTITDVGLASPSDSDLAQLSKAIRFMRLQAVVDGGAPNLMSVTLNPAPAAWAQPLAFVVKIGAGNTSTSATVTCAIAGLSGAKNVVKADGSNPAGGDFPAGKMVLLVYDGAALRCLTVLASDLASTVNNTFNFGISYGVDTSGTPGTIVAASMSPAVSALSTGLFCVVKIANANPGAVTAAIGSTTAKPVVTNDGLAAALAPNTFPNGGCNAFMVYDGTVGAWVLLNVSTASISPTTAPFYPEITTGGGLMTVTPSVGQVVIGANQTWQYRGLRLFSTASAYFSAGALQFATAASKTYHLRWSAPGTGRATPATTYPYGRFFLESLSDTVTYNPSSLAETSVAFDTTFDSMLVARVITDASNNPTVTALLNKNRIVEQVARVSPSLIPPAGSWANSQTDTYFINLARAPLASVVSVNANPQATGAVPDDTPGFFGFSIFSTVLSRYAVAINSYCQAQSPTAGNNNYTCCYTVLLQA